jgi:hypothetical protein
MKLEEHILRVKQRISKLSGEIIPIHDIIKMGEILLEALYSTCSHDYKIIKGDKKAGTVQCTICGESHEFFTVDPVYAATMGKCVPAIKSDLREWKKKIEFVYRMASNLSASELLIINDYIACQIAQCQEQLERVSNESEQ